ncbi:MAG: DoxX family membrane protein [Chitinophagaceae bacterium]|nr:MAG: DoxX family membrane protein [Chitinophagaceae bacterium]
MKLIVNIVRVLTGLLFIFSGLIKAIDPRGLAYKMQEFFEAWSHSGFLPRLMESLQQYALGFSVIMITLEVVVGLALLLGWRRKLTSWLLLLLILFFTFLTSYVLFSGKIRACGCFGDCIPITPVQTFTKDIILLLFAILLLTQRKYLAPLVKPAIAGIIILLATAGTVFLQWYVLRHLPLKDCLAYKVGNNILELRKMPANAVPDKYQMSFIYEKDGQQKEFTAENLPDSSWNFKDRKQTLLAAGKNNVPLINDFNLTTATGNDTTEALLSSNGTYYLLFVKDAAGLPAGFDRDKALLAEASQQHIPLLLVGAEREKLVQRFGSAAPILTTDATALKTAARADAVLYRMNGAVIQQKWGWADFDKVKLAK